MNTNYQKGIEYALSCPEAPINEKDVLSDALLDALFDNSNYIESKQKAVGFISGYPSLAEWRNNKLTVTFVSSGDARRVINDWRREIISRLIDRQDTPLTTFTSVAEDSDILCTFLFTPRELAVLFHHNCPRQQ